MSSEDNSGFIERPGFKLVMLPEARRPKRQPQHQRRTSANLVIAVREERTEVKRALATKAPKLGSKARRARNYAQDMAGDEERERIRTIIKATEAGIQ